MMQEDPVILVMIGLLKRSASSMVKVGVVFGTNLRREYFQLIENRYLGVPSDSSALGYRKC